MNKIQITLNGDEKQLKVDSSVEDAITEWSIKEKTFAIAINEQFIPKDRYKVTTLQEGDQVELLVPMQGG